MGRRNTITLRIWGQKAEFNSSTNQPQELIHFPRGLNSGEVSDFSAAGRGGGVGEEPCKPHTCGVGCHSLVFKVSRQLTLCDHVTLIATMESPQENA